MMSDSTFRVWSRDTNFIPTAAQISQAIGVLKLIFPQATVQACMFDAVTFIDCGANLEMMMCPLCRPDLIERWGTLMENAHASGFTVLAFTTPCCGKPSSIADLRYEMPVGFVRFVIEASNVDVKDYGSLAAITINDALGPYHHTWGRLQANGTAACSILRVFR
jgi:hypothetical protein